MNWKHGTNVCHQWKSTNLANLVLLTTWKTKKNVIFVVQRAPSFPRQSLPTSAFFVSSFSTAAAGVGQAPSTRVSGSPQNRNCPCCFGLLEISTKTRVTKHGFCLTTIPPEVVTRSCTLKKWWDLEVPKAFSLLGCLVGHFSAPKWLFNFGRVCNETKNSEEIRRLCRRV